MRNVILLTNQEGKHLVYGSIVAMLEDPDNPAPMTKQNWNRLQKEGCPIEYSGCIIEKLPMLTATQAKAKETTTRFFMSIKSLI